MVVMGRSGLRRHGLLGPRRAPEVPIRMTPSEPKISTFATIILNRKRFGRFFLLNTASKLQCGAGGALRLSGGASYVPKPFISPKIRPKSPMCLNVIRSLSCSSLSLTDCLVRGLCEVCRTVSRFVPSSQCTVILSPQLKLTSTHHSHM